MKTKAQSTAEYAVLIAIVVVSVLGMATYIQRAISARLENARLDLNKSIK